MNHRVRHFALLVVCLLVSTVIMAEQHYVRVLTDDVPVAKTLIPESGFRQDYGPYQWMAVSESEFQRLNQAGLIDKSQQGARIRFMNWDFDPLASPPAELGRVAPLDDQGRGLALVQFHGPIIDAWLKDIEQAGFELIQYYPHNTYLVYGNPERLNAARAHAFVRWAGGFVPEFKLSPVLAKKSGLVENVYVHFLNTGSPSTTLSAVADLGGVVVNQFPAQSDRRLFDAIVRMDASGLAALGERAEVIWMGFADPKPVLDDESSSQTVAGNFAPSGQPDFNYPGWLSDVGLDGSGVTWAITDTGVDYNHPDLNTRIIGGQNYPGCEFANPGDDPSSGGHGTHVAGIVGGDATAGFTDPDGYLYGLGVAPGYSIFAQNPICGSQVSWPPAGGWQVLSQNAILGGAVGTNNSWTSGEGTAHGYQATERAHDLIVRDGDFDTTDLAEPFVIVFSAGNSGPGAMTLTSPKEAKNVIVTAGTQTWRVSNDVDQMYNSSSRGPAVDGRYIPTIAAPGQSVGSTRNDDGGSCGTAIGGTNNLYSFCTGTSMASPHAAGSVVLITEWWRNNNSGETQSPAMSKALLINTGTDIQDTDAPPIPNFDEGWGRITLRSLFQSTVPFEFFDQTDVLGMTGESWQRTVGVVDPLQPLKVTLVWSDAPGAIGANPALVNDLDLVVDTNGNTYLGNVFSGGSSVTGGTADALNNMENVFVMGGGSATITVNATNIAGDGVPYNADATDQDFALVCQNCALQADFTLDVAATAADVCAPDPGLFDVSIGSILSFVDPVTLAVSGNPAGLNPAFTPSDTVMPPGMANLSITGTDAVAPGSYALTVEATSTTGTKSRDLDLGIFDAAPGVTPLTAPTDAAINVDTRATFQWTAPSQASEYLLEVDDDPAFGSPEISVVVSGESYTPSTPLASNTQFYWRVTATNPCDGTASTVFSFITLPEPGDCAFGHTPQTLYFDNMESGAPGWTHDGTQDTWQLSGDNTFSGSFAWYGEDLTTTSDQRLISPAINLPVDRLPLTLQFQNHQTLEAASGGGCWDAGILEISTDGGNNWTPMPGSTMLTDPYDGTVRQSSSPISGQEAWCGDPHDWTESIVDLSAYQGQQVRFRFRLGTDGSVGRVEGWKIDDVRVQACPPPGFVFGNGFEGNALP